MVKRLLRREHVVAASLVGAVVIVVGFASGLGTQPATAGQAPSGDDVEAAPPAETQQPQQDSPSQTDTPQRHTGSAGGGSSGGGRAPVTNPPGTGHTGHPQPPTQPPTTPPTTPPDPNEPENPCEPGLVPRSLDTLLATLTRATDTIGLLNGVTVVPVEQALAGLAPTDVPTVVDTSTGLMPLDQFLATCPPAEPAAPASAQTTPETAAAEPTTLAGLIGLGG